MRCGVYCGGLKRGLHDTCREYYRQKRDIALTEYAALAARADGTMKRDASESSARCSSCCNAKRDIETLEVECIQKSDVMLAEYAAQFNWGQIPVGMRDDIFVGRSTHRMLS